MKRCFKCLVEKPLTEFYRHRLMADGHLSKCKDCARADVKAHRDKNVERVRQYDKDRSVLPHRVALRKSISDSWRDAFPERRQAQNAACNAVRAGEIETPASCEGCGTTSRRIEKHHPDYSKPLLVVWLCKPCHAIADKIRRRLEAS